MRGSMQGQAGGPSRQRANSRRVPATHRRPAPLPGLCGALLVTAIFAGTIMMVGEFRERALVNSERELENTVTLLARHFDQQFEDSDTIASNMIAKLQIADITSPEDFKARMSTPDTHQ